MIDEALLDWLKKIAEREPHGLPVQDAPETLGRTIKRAGLGFTTVHGAADLRLHLTDEGRALVA